MPTLTPNKYKEFGGDPLFSNKDHKRRENLPIKEFNGRHRFLSNFYPVEITTDDGITYPSVENAYQAHKSNDNITRKLIATLSPKDAKKDIRKYVTDRKAIKKFDETKLFLMKKLLEKKFKQSKFRELLLDTGDAYLIEGNWWRDYFWGVCDGYGDNHLGELLMEIRLKLRVSYDPEAFNSRRPDWTKRKIRNGKAGFRDLEKLSDFICTRTPRMEQVSMSEICKQNQYAIGDWANGYMILSRLVNEKLSERDKITIE